MYKIPVYKPMLGSEERSVVLECIDSSWISSRGKYVDLFEENFSNYTGIKHSISVSNGTVALHLALAALGISSGDEVIVPTFTYIASVNAISYVGAKPVFVDSNSDDWQMCLQDVQRKITSKTKAIIAVHLYGQCCDLDKLREICDSNNILLIEDCAEAFGCKYKNKHVGHHADVSTFSFFGNKTITTGEGGMVCTGSSELFERTKRMRSQGVSPTKQYWHDMIGFNFRMTNICAALGYAQLKRADTVIEKKRYIAKYYFEGLKSTPLKFLSEQGDTFNSYWMITAAARSEVERDTLRKFLSDKGIETRPSFYPVHTMPMYKCEEDFPGADSIAYVGINFPSFPELTDVQLSEIVASIEEFYAQH